MKHSVVRLLVLVGLFATLVTVSSPLTVHAAGVCLSGTGNFLGSTGFIAVHPGDVVTATITADNPSDSVEVFIVSNATLYAHVIRTGSAIATVKITATDNISALFNDTNSLFPASGYKWSLSVGPGCSSGSANGPLFNDGRLNSHDGAETAAIYCDKGNVIIYSTGNPWKIALIVTTGEIDRVPSLPEENTLIKQNAKVGVALYRLSSGELQVNAPGDAKGPYSFIFTDCPREH